MEEHTNIIPKETGKGVYSFENLLPANYVIKISYGSIVDEKNIKVPVKDNMLDMTFTPLFNIKLDILDVRGFPLNGIKVIANREGKKIEKFADNHAIFSLPPGVYKIDAYYDSNLVGSKKLDVTKDGSDYILTMKGPFFPLLVEIFALVGAIVIVSLFLLRKISMSFLFRMLAFISIIGALVLPWWSLHGSSTTHIIERWCSAYLIPSNIVTMTKFGDNPVGELSNIPPEFNIFLSAIIATTILGGFLGIISVLIKRRRKIMMSILFIGLFILIASAGLYVFAMNELCKVGLGSLQGFSTLNIENPFTGECVNIEASWGLSIGFHMLCFAISLMVLPNILDFLKARLFKIKLK